MDSRLYSFYMVHSCSCYHGGNGVKIEETSLVRLSYHFTSHLYSCLKQLYFSKRWSYGGECGEHGHHMRIEAFKI